MGDFILKIGGINPSYLAGEKVSDRFAFYLTGFISMLFGIASICSSYSLLSSMGTPGTWSIILALISGFIFLNMYVYTLSTISFSSVSNKNIQNFREYHLKNNELTVADQTGTAIKVFLFMCLILYISKPIELHAFSNKITEIIATKKDSAIAVKPQYTILQKIETLHAEFPQTWLITLLTEFLFLTPIVWRSTSFKLGNYNYELVKHRKEIEQILENYGNMKFEYKRILTNIYADTLQKYGLQAEIAELYRDSPFNRMPHDQYDIQKYNNAISYNNWIKSLPTISTSQFDLIIHDDK